MRRKNRAMFKASGAIVTPAGFLLSPFFNFSLQERWSTVAERKGVWLGSGRKEGKIGSTVRVSEDEISRGWLVHRNPIPVSVIEQCAMLQFIKSYRQRMKGRDCYKLSWRQMAALGWLLSKFQINEKARIEIIEQPRARTLASPKKDY